MSAEGRGEWPPVKSQNVRLFGIVVLGPAMIFAGAAASTAARRSPLLGVAGLITFVGGFGTIASNAVNYGRVGQRLRAQEQAAQAMRTTQGLGAGYWEADPAWGAYNLSWQRYMRSSG